MVAALIAKALELLTTPTGALSLVAALLAGGVALREYRGRRSGSGLGLVLRQADVAGERTGELRKDFNALGPAGSEADVLAADLKKLEGRLDGVASEMRAGHASLQEQIVQLGRENQEQGITLEAKIAEVRKNGPAETSSLVVAELRKHGLFNRRKRREPYPPNLDRRRAGPE